MYSNLKEHIDKQIGEHGYIQLNRHDGVMLCEGQVGELRLMPLWALIDEENARIGQITTSRIRRGNCRVKIVITLR